MKKNILIVFSILLIICLIFLFISNKINENKLIDDGTNIKITKISYNPYAGRSLYESNYVLVSEKLKYAIHSYHDTNNIETKKRIDLTDEEISKLLELKNNSKKNVDELKIEDKMTKGYVYYIFERNGIKTYIKRTEESKGIMDKIFSYD